MTRAHPGLKTAALAGASALVLSSGWAGMALAADAQHPTTLDEVLVTARRVNENVQTTPVSVSAVSLKQIEDLNITRLENIQKLAPNLHRTLALMLVEMVPAKDQTFVYILEPVFLVHALAEQARGRRSVALALATACAFVKPSMASFCASGQGSLPSPRLMHSKP